MPNLDFYASERAATPLRGQLLPSKELASEAFCHSEASGLKCRSVLLIDDANPAMFKVVTSRFSSRCLNTRL